MASLTDWFARTFFISSEQEETSNQVKAAQQAIVDRQFSDGTINTFEHAAISRDIGNTGTTFFNQELGRSGTAGLPGLAFHYWWIWAAIGVGLFIYLGGFAWLKRHIKWA